MNAQPALVPLPLKLDLHDRRIIVGPSLDIIAVDAARGAAEYLGDMLKRGAGRAIRYIFPPKPDIRFADTREQSAGGAPNQALGRIRFALAEGNEEGYRLSILPEELLVEAAAPAGFFWAVQTLRQLLPKAIEEGSPAEPEARGERGKALDLPSLEIVDRPRFPWRGLHLDVSRHFFSVPFLKRLIDVLALYKLNRFHWHLTDDQGWRIEIRRFPELTEVGAWRREPGGSRYGGYYTQEEVREIVSYATERGVTVVPEIEMPGHARAALAAFPWLSCTKEVLDVWNQGGISQELFCAGREETFEFLEGVLEEVAGLFPSEFIHIGGDECPKERWRTCPECQRRIAQEGLADEEQLQGYFIRRIQGYLSSLGKRLIGWDEILEGGLAPGATVMSWRGLEGGIAAARSGHHAIMAPTSHCYLDYRQSANRGEPGPTHFDPPVTTLRKVYAFEPIPEGLSEEYRHYVIGSQGNLWTEDVDSEERAGYMVFPRLCALAEVLWTPSEARNWHSFKERLAQNIGRLDALSMEYCKTLETIE